MFAETKFFHKAGEGSGGGSDPHNLGYYADLTALQTAHPTGTDGDFAILGSTDTIWVWDSGTSAWKDTDTKGQVTSVNGQTGVVTVDTLPDQTGQSGKFLTTDGTDASWATINALQNTGTGLDGFVVGGTPSGNAYITSVGIGSTAQAQGAVVVGHNSNAGGYAERSVVVGKEASATGSSGVAIGYKAKASSTDTVSIGREAEAKKSNSTAVGKLAKATSSQCVAVGGDSEAGTGAEYVGGNAVAVGYYAKATAAGAIQLGNGTNNTTGTLQIGLNTGGVYGTTNQYVLLNSDGTIPADRLPNAINKYSTMPTAAPANDGWIVQFTGTTDSTYTHGYIYECKAQGTDPETYAWEAVSVQAGGGSSLPSQTGNSGKFLTTDGTNASWGEALKRVGSQSKDLGILASYVIGSGQGGTAIGIGAESESYGGSSVAMGYQAVAGTSYPTNTYSCVALGPRCKATGSRGIAIGYSAQATAACAMQIGPGTNSTANTCQLGYYNGSSFTTYQLLDFTTGTIPAARHATLPATDGTYTLQLVITNGVPTLSWVAV